MAKGRILRVQDSVHGLMEFCGMEAVVVDVLRTPELQRLRRIRQLGLAYLVFPGGEHSRLTHSLGTAHIAVRFGRHIRDIAHEFFIPVLCPDESVIRDLAVAALCHDLGHGPLSHAWEREVIGDTFSASAWIAALELPKEEEALKHLEWHELVAQGLLAWEGGQLHQLLEQHEEGSSLRIRRLLSGKYDVTYLPRLISSDVDVDRSDFIRRDTHQTGVTYGRYDLDWLISTCTMGKLQHRDGEEWVIGFDSRKGVRVIEQFLIARQALYETVYQHKTVRCAEAMVAKVLKRLKHSVQRGVRFDTPPFVKPMLDIIGGGVVSNSDLMKLDDFSLLVLIDHLSQTAKADPTLADLARRVMSRDLFKLVPVSTERLREFLEKEHSRELLYDAVKAFCPGDGEYYIIEDNAEFRMMSKTPESKVYLVDTQDPNRLATPAHDHPALLQYERISVANRRIYTVREAVDRVKKVIEENSR